MIKKILVILFAGVCCLLCQCTGRTVAKAPPPLARIAVVNLLGQDIQVIYDTRDPDAKDPRWAFHQQQPVSFNPQQLSNGSILKALQKAGYEPTMLGTATAGLGPVVSMTESGLPPQLAKLVESLTQHAHYDKILLIVPKTLAINNVGEVEGFGAICHGGKHFPTYGGYMIYLYDAPRNNLIARLGDSFVTNLSNTPQSLCQTHKDQLTNKQMAPIEREMSLFLRRSLATKVHDIVRGVG